MATENEYTEALRAWRAELVETRRRHVKDRSQSGFREFQLLIEAVDRAIQDERQKIKPEMRVR